MGVNTLKLLKGLKSFITLSFSNDILQLLFSLLNCTPSTVINDKKRKTRMATPSYVLLPPGGERILFILAHPDDAEFLCGGTVARLTEEGCEVHYLLVTRGDKGSGDPQMTSQQLATIREEEQRNAANVLGVQSVTFLDYLDGEVEVTIPLRRELVYHIRKLKPDVTFTFDPWKKNEIHPDHRAVGMCTLDALACARGVMYYPEHRKEGLDAHRANQIYFFGTDRANFWVDITSTIEKKLEALSRHASQMMNFDADEYIRRKAREAGVEHRYRYAEAFHHYVMA
jgi:LmbE family N-acetylglucosaminyl deacetylase